jgi:23S rRNA pseudouridine2605 synthase
LTELELLQQRHAKWRLDGVHPVRTFEDASGFIAEVGLCLMDPAGPAVPAPTFVGAVAGSEDRLPATQQAFNDPRAQQARELMLRLLRGRAAFEAQYGGEDILLISAEAFPYFYALVGERNPKRELESAAEKASPLARDAYKLIQAKGPISKRHLGEALGGAPSEAALDRALGELWSRLLITRTDYKTRDGIFWDALHRWAPAEVRSGRALSIAEGLSALISKYLETVVAAEAGEIESFFSPFASRSRVRDAVNALLAAREFALVQVGRKSMIQIAPAATTTKPTNERRRTSSRRQA